MTTAKTVVSRFSPSTVSGFAHVLLLTFVIARTVRTTMDPDLFWHLRTGDVIVHDGIPREDIFSFTVPGAEWITHEWLSQVLAWFAYSLGGLVAVAVLFAIVGMACLTFVYKAIDAGPTLKVVLTMFVFKVADLSFGARIQLLTLALAALFVWMVERVRRGESPAKSLWWAIPVSLVWANLHSGFLLGVIILATYAAGEYAQRRWFTVQRNTLAAADTILLVKVAVGSFAVAVLNPSTWKLWVYPISTLRSDAMRTIIAEWQSPNFHQSTFYPFALLILGGAVVLGMSERKVSVTDVLLFCGTAAAGLSSLRHIALAAVVGVPVLAPHLVSALQRTRFGDQASGRTDRALTVNPVLMKVLSTLLLVGGSIFALSTLVSNQDRVEELYPVDAIAYIDSEGLTVDHGYNSYRYGGYLIWTDHEVFIDGRADVYWDFLWEYYELANAGADWQRVVNEFDLQWALVHPGEPIVRVFDVSSEWSVAYTDDIASVYVREAE